MKAFALVCVTFLVLLFAAPAASMAAQRFHSPCDSKMKCCHQETAHAPVLPKGCEGKSCNPLTGCCLFLFSLPAIVSLDFTVPGIEISRTAITPVAVSSPAADCWQPPEFA